MNPFEYLNAINYSKKDIMVDDIAEKAYDPYLINRSLSYFADTILLVNEMNIHHFLDNRLQFDFCINSISKKKRFSKWIKSHEPDSLKIIKEYYSCSNEKAKSALRILSQGQIEAIKLKLNTGGRRNK